MSEDILPKEWNYDSMTEMLREQYPGTDNRGGLNIQQKEGSEINAVLVPMTGEETNFYEDMVLGYHLENMDADKIDASVNLPVIAAVSHNTMMLILSMAMLRIVWGLGMIGEYIRKDSLGLYMWTVRPL
jgi:hypothetical protein